MKVSIFDVARRSGLSVVTVSRVINNAESVRPKNREKVLQAMRELDYQPNAAARSLARGKTGIIGLTLTTLYDSVFDVIVKEINDRLAEHGYFLAISVTQEKEEGAHGAIFQEDRVDGVILLSPVRENEFVLELKKKGIPFVMLDNQHRNPSVTSVVVDNFKGGYEATKHLVDLGHKEIAHISGTELFLSSRERERGFLFAMEEAGLTPMAVERGRFEVASGYEIASKWLEDGKLPSAVFASDDHIALGVMDALKNSGVRIPQDVSIVGYDDQLLASQFRPKLTTVRQPARLIGRHGVELLLDAINGETKKNVTLQLEPQLIVRDSTARKE
ncbi:LacI family DNA-binding transcriptional regulator [Paenibacillus methanolicus]|uniref:LacI family transcriptional regulator/LacI family purine nucleotide synthesis repressor n=1 Tax=Paenibacillus methanolicus TaxID=582686 RepID=A0A5S5C854_9BACL|nr:LacI family DNA-binding transcriptional regulator [Paenibacillus methanolicus]TYP75487.1 LacI family transcriptional regulator/LacI family purine nucleotide synthesis repressor [Paenibacillus methanolicus]